MDEEKTIEEIKEIVDSKRPRKYTKEERIKNLEKARANKQLKKKEDIIEPKEPIIVEPAPVKILKQREPKIAKTKSIHNDIDKLADLYEDIKNIKELIAFQSSVIEKSVIRPKPKPKKDKAIKVLDKAVEVTPQQNIPYDATIYSIVMGYYQAAYLFGTACPVSDFIIIYHQKACDCFRKVFPIFQRLVGCPKITSHCAKLYRKARGQLTEIITSIADVALHIHNPI
jgi:hypothetical protein